MIDTKYKILTLSTIVFIILMISCIIFLNKKNYNNGIHNNCGGHWIYQEAVGHQSYTGYIYSCDKCGEVIEIISIFR